MIDAKNNNVYLGLFELKNNIYTQIGDLYFKTIDEVIDLLKNHTSSISFVGDGAIKNKEKLKNNFENCIFLEKNELSSYSLGLAGLNAYKNGLASSLMPLYLRKSQAERSLEEKSKKG